MRFIACFVVALAGLLTIQEGVSQKAPQERVGPLADGGFLLNSGWTIRPAGQQVPVDTFPMRSAVSDGGKYLLIMNAGYNPPSISVIDIQQKREVGRTPLPDCWLGLTVASRNHLVYAGGGSSAKIYELSLNTENGALTRTREFAAVPDLNQKGVAFIGDIAVSADAHLLYAADLYNDSIAVINLQSGRLIDRWKCGRRPYGILVSPDGRQVVVSSWADAAVYQYDANSGVMLGKTRIGAHPTDMLWINKPPPTDAGESSYVGRLFVTASNTNNVYSLGITQDGQFSLLESINVSMTPMHPLGMTPSALAIDERGTRLYIACSDANAIALSDISATRSRMLGFIPTGWYPTAVRVIGDEMAVLNGKGLGSRANPDGPNPTRPNQPLYEGGPVVAPGYVAHIQTGTVAFLPLPGEEQLTAFSETVMKNSPYRDEMIYGPIDDAQEAFFSRTEGHESPIRHVIYVIKENRTYDQVLGDMEKGNGDKSLNLFGEQATPNLHQLAREFILYDNFYENSDVSADGHNWASAAIAPDYTMKVWPNEYGHRSHLYNFEGGEPANTPPAGYIWDNALQAGLSVRDYGEWTTNIPLKLVTGPRQIQKANDSNLQPYVDMNYRGFDLEYSDVNRANEFIHEWKDFDAKGQAPQMIILRMGNDHTQGTRPGALTPLSYAADNDYGVGLVVDAVSHSKLWSSTAIFIIEDDAQNGPDHVDSHRAPAWVISPYTHVGTVDSLMYNQTSILRTMELIVGLRPLTHFDAAARPMFAGFSQQPDSRPYSAILPKRSTTERNLGNAVGAAESARMDFSNADLIDDDELNAVLWRAIKHSDPPPPMRSAFTR
ncbi:MAG: bifunctional YncE family protein/alkaline phosphatase family protein [Acidobacteriaceae bacterium]|nr:bifunctional YncE family protein/alkaline phosphatase family protein [Acidobacteriaceae bacterium]